MILPNAKSFCFDAVDSDVWTNAAPRLACSTQITTEKTKRIHDRDILWIWVLLICLPSDDMITTAMLLLRVDLIVWVSVELVIIYKVALFCNLGTFFILVPCEEADWMKKNIWWLCQHAKRFLALVSGTGTVRCPAQIIEQSTTLNDPERSRQLLRFRNTRGACGACSISYY